MDEAASPAPPPPARTIGERLRAGRERAGLSVAAAAEKLHLDNRVIESLEADRFGELGASVYVRGHLKRYGDFVGEPGSELVAMYSSREARPAPPDLTQVPHPERRSNPRGLITPLTGLAVAAVLALAIWWVLSRASTDAGSKPAASRDIAPVTGALALPADRPQADVVTAAPQPVQTAPVTPAPAPEPTPRPETPARETRLRVGFANDSWVEIYDARGQRLYYDIASAGSVQNVTGRGPLRVVLGNASGVSVEVDGEAREIPANTIEGEGARFVVNRSGSLSRARP